MNTYTADLHIHTVLSPCGDLEMSPVNIVRKAAEQGLDVIAITDHNHTGHAQLTREIGEEAGIWVVYGAELTSAEEVHCLTFFDTDEQLLEVQNYIKTYLPIVANDPDLFGHQVIVDREENIITELATSLYPALYRGVGAIARFIHEIGGLFVPAHVDRRMNGLYSQLGLFPDDLSVDAVEIHRNSERRQFIEAHSELSGKQLLKNSDAHFIADVGRCKSRLVMESRNFEEFSQAIRGENGRKVIQE